MTHSETTAGETTAGDTPQRPKFSRGARITVALTLAFLTTHMILTATTNTTNTHLKNSLPGTLATTYTHPYLVQDYKIFAPDPASANHQLWIRAWIELPNGQRTRSPWINTTRIELTTTTQKTLRKQLTIVGAERLMAAYQNLTPEQQHTAQNNHLQGPTLYPLRDALTTTNNTNPTAINAFIRANNYTTSYATQAAHALWGNQGTLLGVQSRAVYSPVIRWNDRHTPNATPPPSTYTDLGWVPPMEWPGQDREAFARTFTTWATKSGINTTLDPDNTTNTAPVTPETNTTGATPGEDTP